MRCMNINKQPFYYALYQGRQPITNSYGEKTGEYENVYTTPVKTSGNISVARGESESRQFGENAEYDKVLVLDSSLNMDEHSILWIDTLPIINDDGSTNTPHDYIVKKVAKSINSVSIAVNKVTVSE